MNGDTKEIQASRPVLIVDIDETILDVTYRKTAILEELFGIRPNESDIKNDYNLVGFLSNDDKIHSFFQEFHSGKYLHKDTAINSAAETLHKIVEKMDIVYLTGRHAKGEKDWMSQEQPTLTSLETNGFPIPNFRTVFLMMKPFYPGFESISVQEIQGYDFKKKAVENLVKSNRVPAGIGDSFTDLLVYGLHNVKPICLKRPHFSSFENRLPELPIKPTVIDNWQEMQNIQRLF